MEDPVFEVDERGVRATRGRRCRDKPTYLIVKPNLRLPLSPSFLLHQHNRVLDRYTVWQHLIQSTRNLLNRPPTTLNESSSQPRNPSTAPFIPFLKARPRPYNADVESVCRRYSYQLLAL